MSRLIIIGASGHGKVVAEVARQSGYTDVVFLDANPEIQKCGDYHVVGSDSMVPQMEGDLFVAIGNAKTRREIMEQYKYRYFPVLKHPASVIASNVTIGAGTVIMPGAVINPGTVIGKGCIVNTSSSVDHDCVVGDYCHISVGVHLAGTVHVGAETWVGIGSVVSNNISICSNCVIGAGAVVVKDITASGTYIGVPARRFAGK